MRRCRPEEIALKSFFLGPQSENAEWLQKVINDILSDWFTWRQRIYPRDGFAISKSDQEVKDYVECRKTFEDNVKRLSKWLENEVPQFSPRYMGHMFSEISLPALLGHIVTLLHNPNNISSEASRVGVRIENEAISSLAKMAGYDPSARGHFTSGGTIANFEALIRAKTRLEKWQQSALSESKKLTLFEASHSGWQKQLSSFEKRWTNAYDFTRSLEEFFNIKYRGPVLLVSSNRHYSWDKGLSLMGLGEESLWPVELNRFGRMSLQDLEKKIERAHQEQRPILMVCSILGATERGSIDDIHFISDALEKWARRGIHIWHHVDAAYGGFLRTLAQNSDSLAPDRLKAIESLPRANSLTLDPHKLGYVPYSCGAFLTKNEIEYASIQVQAPYIDFRPENDRGPQTLEGSRPASGAAATWMAAQCMGFDADGYGQIISRTLRATTRLEELLKQTDSKIKVLPHRDANILCFCIARDGETISKSNLQTMEVFRRFSPDQNSQFIVSKTSLRWNIYREYLDHWTSEWHAKVDCEELKIIRLCMMNPFYDSREMKIDFSAEFAKQLLSLIKDQAVVEKCSQACLRLAHLKSERG